VDFSQDRNLYSYSNIASEKFVVDADDRLWVVDFQFGGVLPEIGWHMLSKYDAKIHLHRIRCTGKRYL
jgi:hypothetical protein